MAPVRILYADQPFAQLIARAVMPFIAFPRVPPVLGRYAVVAKRAAPSNDTFRLAAEHERLARTFARQGWLTRDHIAALPRGVMVGTVEVREARAVRAVLLDPRRADQNPDDRLDITAAGGDGRHDPGAFVMPVWNDDYLWMLVNPIEIEPIEGVSGRQTELTDDQAKALADAERGAREAAFARAAAQQGGTKQPTRRRTRERLEALDMKRLSRVAERAGAAAEKGSEVERELRWAAEDRFERVRARTISRYYAMYPLRHADGRAHVRIVGADMQSLFPGAAWVPREDFERRVGLHIRGRSPAPSGPREIRPPLWDLHWHLPRLARVVQVGATAGIHVLKRGRGKDKKRLDRLRAHDDQAKVLEERDDPNDPPDLRDFDPEE